MWQIVGVTGAGKQLYGFFSNFIHVSLEPIIVAASSLVLGFFH